MWNTVTIWGSFIKISVFCEKVSQRNCIFRYDHCPTSSQWNENSCFMIQPDVIIFRGIVEPHCELN